MRCIFGFLCVCALVGTLPQSASAQTDEEGATSEPNLEQPAAPSSELAPEESALQLKARAWLIGTAVVTAIGVPLLAVGLTYDRRQPPSEGLDLDFTGVGLATAGGIMLFVGVPGMAVSGGTLGISKRKLRRLEQAHYGTGRRVQWDLSESRLVF
jgi:hypothetical protein